MSDAEPEAGEPSAAQEPLWRDLLREQGEPEALEAERHLGGPISGSFSSPHLYLADEREWVVKFPRAGQRQALIADQVLGRLGELIGAAVGEYAAIRIEPGFLPAGEPPESAGVAHACARIPDVTDKSGVDHLAANRTRFASLAIFYTWTNANDHQVIYQQGAEPVVYSVDHGHFLPGAENWTPGDLAAHPLPVALEPWVMSHGISIEECRPAAVRVRAVTPTQIASVVRAARDEWGIDATGREALCDYLWKRQAATLALVPEEDQGGE